MDIVIYIYILHRDIAANIYLYMYIYMHTHIYIEFVSARLREIGGDGLQEYGMDTVIYIYLYFYIEIYQQIYIYMHIYIF